MAARHRTGRCTPARAGSCSRRSSRPAWVARIAATPRPG